MDFEFAYYSSLLRRIARIQMVLDKQFSADLLSLRGKLHAKKISPKMFWEQYKKALIKSVEKNKRSITSILDKVDKEMGNRLKEAEQREVDGKPPLDLSLPK